ncbi:NAD(P)/FAD-dependent oxidoreductase [Komagataeibacter rhaeticus]|nr:NAD(P)/FAD-dependent oxidoreductase [Komagataeibacter rhaeticus]
MTGTGYDVIVVGSGAAGGFAAKTLTDEGLSVLVIEAGRTLSDRDIKPRAGASRTIYSFSPHQGHAVGTAYPVPRGLFQ